MSDAGNDSALDRTYRHTDGIVSCLLPFRSLAEGLSPNQQPDHTTDQADGSKGCENPQIDQCDTGLFDEAAYRIPSRGETGATHDAEFSLSDEKNPAILRVNLNGAARACSLRNKYSVNAIGTSFWVKADVRPSYYDVRFTPNSGHQPSALPCPLSAKADMVGKTP